LSSPEAPGERAREKEAEAPRLLGEICEIREAMAGEPIEDYAIDTDGGARALSSLFTEHDRLLLIHNMGVTCEYCAAYADGINGILRHLQRNIDVVLVSNDPLERLRAFGGERSWQLRLGSVRDTSLSRDLGFEPSPGELWPGMCAIARDSGVLVLANRYSFEPGDFFSPFWPLERFAGGPDAQWTLD
jgi:predicted dithiol-disulfide oxidoreductase (DUF899 family)